MSSMERTIAEALAARLVTLSWVKTVEYLRPRINISDYQEHELPAIQFYDAERSITHQHCLIRSDWRIVIELIIKSTETNVQTQCDLWDKMQDIEELIGGRVNLNIPRVFHFKYLGARTNIMAEPFYIGQMDFDVLFDKEFTV